MLLPHVAKIPAPGQEFCAKRMVAHEKALTQTPHMDLNKFTEKSQAALMEAQNLATRNQHQTVDVEHLLLALLEQEGGLVSRLFDKARVSPELLQTRLEEELHRIPRVSGDTTTGQGLYVTQRLNQLLVKSQDEA